MCVGGFARVCVSVCGSVGAVKILSECVSVCEGVWVRGLWRSSSTMEFPIEMAKIGHPIQIYFIFLFIYLFIFYLFFYSVIFFYVAKLRHHRYDTFNAGKTYSKLCFSSMF